MSSKRLWYTAPPTEYISGLPIGTGRLAAMVIGASDPERVALNHEWFWRGPNRMRDIEPAAHMLGEVRELLLAGNYAEGTEKGCEAFGGPISRFQILQGYLADMLINLENARNLTYKAAWLADQGRPYHVEATMAKLVAAEGALHAGRYGVEILGGYGICSEYPMQRFLRDSLLIQFAPISNEMSKNILMQFQGLPKSWP